MRKGSSGNTTQAANIDKCMKTLGKVYKNIEKYSQSINKYKNTKESLKSMVSTEAPCQNHRISAIAQHWT